MLVRKEGGQALNEIQLSSDLNVITAEIQSYKQIAGQSIFEIGRRLKGVRDNPEEYGLDGYQDWENWCEKEVELSRTHANRFIKVAEELEPSGFLNLGIKALYEIATLPEEERKKEHVTSKGETKTPDEMTVRELQELKRQLKQEKEQNELTKKQLEQAKRSEEIALRKLEEEQSKEPEKIEVVPDDYDFYKGGYESLEGTMNFYKEQNKEMRDELKELEKIINDKEPINVDDGLIKQLREEEEKLKEKLNESYKMIELIESMEIFMSVALPKKHSIEFNRLRDNPELLDQFESNLDGLINWCNDIKKILPDKNIIEGVFNDE